MLGPIVGGGGLGRYVEELVNGLAQLGHKHRLVLFLKNERQASVITKRCLNVQLRIADTHWYTFKEQLVLSRIIDREKLDLVHFPHWNVPLFIKTPFVVTIHDLILLEEPKSAKITTRSPIVFALKHLAYKIVLRHVLKRSRIIVAVSNHTKASILKHFPWVPAEKIRVIYEGIVGLSSDGNVAHKTEKSLLYVGNAYPHKNLEKLLEAFKILVDSDPTFTLTLAGREDIFYERIKTNVRSSGLKNRVRFVMNPSDEELHDLYCNATLFVFPSRNEGFGLPPLEAMSIGLPVVSSRAASLPEILGDAALYFDPTDAEEIAKKIQLGITDKNLREELKLKGFERIKNFSWAKMAEEILKIYEHAC
jgi:glycosyltransferase involved in cell wall biosynthesis